MRPVTAYTMLEDKRGDQHTDKSVVKLRRSSVGEWSNRYDPYSISMADWRIVQFFVKIGFSVLDGGI